MVFFLMAQINEIEHAASEDEKAASGPKEANIQLWALYRGANCIVTL